MITESPASNQFVPEQNSTAISTSTNQENISGDLQTQNESQVLCATSTMLNVKREPGLSYYLGEDSDVICLGEKSNDVITIEDDPATQELFLQCNDLGTSTLDDIFPENLITVQTQPTTLPTVTKTPNI